MVRAQEENPDREPASWRIRRWAAPVTLALAVAASIGAVQVLADETPMPHTFFGEYPVPRFTLTVGVLGTGIETGEPAPWLRVDRFRSGQSPQPVEAVQRPSPSAGDARSITAGPGGTFLVASTHDVPCESRLYRFELTRDGHVRKLRQVTDAVLPGRVRGLAMSPDGDKVAYTTTPCPDGGPGTGTPLPARAEVTVLDVDSGDRRTWSTTGPALAREIVWARDSRTLGYVVSDVLPGAQPTVGDVALYALDTEDDGADLRKGRVLFRRPDAAATVTTAVMNPDGRTGYGVLRRGDPATTVLFDFAEGGRMHVTKTFEPEPEPGSNSVTSVGKVVMVAVEGDSPRYACLESVASSDSFNGGRIQETFSCGAAWAY
jgi:hypothetical protein